ncbi:myb-like protein P [Musca vetustissima]|uniref:myb-like protein P n=1 Tax=Musca vetustissima TaxID=27455 RepID=UPI002AB63D0E|nr:myb-like protein P [Musca vetustissima]
MNSNNSNNNKRGHIRSASLENANSLISKNTLGLPMVPSHNSATGTLKSRNEQKRMRNKFGSHSNLDDFVQQGRNKFNNIRQMFELTKGGMHSKTMDDANNNNNSSNEPQSMQSLPPMMTTSLTSMTCSPTSSASASTSNLTSASLNHNKYSPMMMMTMPKRSAVTRKPPIPTPPTNAASPAAQAGKSENGCGIVGSRNSITEVSERLNINEQQLDVATANNKIQQQHQQHQQRQILQAQRTQTHTALVHSTQQQQQQAQQQHHVQAQHLHHQTQPQQLQQPQRSASDLSYIQTIDENHEQQTTNLLRPIAFKPIPFEPDYTIPSRYCDVVTSAQSATASVNSNNNPHNMIVGDRYGSTPSLAAVPGSNMRFGSTTDLRHSGNGGGMTLMTAGGLHGNCSVGGSGVIVGGGGYSSNNYCNSLMARRRGSRSLKINDSMESIRHTPDSDINSQTGTLKSNDSGGSGLNMAMTSNSSASSNTNTMASSSSCSSASSSTTNKYHSDQCDMTPSPSDSGISDLEAALKDRDSELSYLRQTMEHNEKVIFKVQKDKESYWENETKRLKLYYEAQQREYMLKIKKMEQMVAMQQFQFKQHKLRHNEQTQKLREQLAELKSEYEMLKTNNISIKNSERNLKDRSAYIEEQYEESQNTVARLKAQLEESEWKVCEKNGEIALLKTQLKEATNELTLKEHAIVHLKHENTNAETQIYQSLQENQKITQQQMQEVEQNAQSQKETQTELKQLNKIIILKDQVILALTNELAKLRKELSDLAIFHEYGEEPSGKYTRLKQQLDNLTDICNKTRKHTQQRIENHKNEEKQDHQPEATEKVIDDTNLEVIINCLKISPPQLDEENGEEKGDANYHERELNKLNCELRLAKMSSDIQNFVYGSQNLPDIALNTKLSTKLANCPLEEATLDTLIEESASYAEEIAKLRKQLDVVRVNFEQEKRQWSAEKEKVLQYQKQLQSHYISMYQKLRNLEKTNEV